MTKVLKLKLYIELVKQLQPYQIEMQYGMTLRYIIKPKFY